MKSLCLTAAGMLCLLAACNNPQTTGSENPMTKKNLDAVNIVNKAFESGDVSHVDEAVAVDFVDHTDKGDMGRDSLKAMIMQMHKTGKETKMQTVKQVADNDYVFETMRYTGTGDGVMMPPGPYDMHAVEVVRLKEGKAVEHWSYMDAGEMMKMMSQMKGAPNGMPAGKADTVIMHK